jgi:hypothetical protein
VDGALASEMTIRRLIDSAVWAGVGPEKKGVRSGPLAGNPPRIASWGRNSLTEHSALTSGGLRRTGDAVAQPAESPVQWVAAVQE